MKKKINLKKAPNFKILSTDGKIFELKKIKKETIFILKLKEVERL